MSERRPFDVGNFAKETDSSGTRALDLAEALTTWTWLRGDDQRITDAMAAFNCTEAAIRAAVECGAWIDILGDGPDALLCVDGE